ncbi:ABC transporter ATP-binding protein [Facklamia miroungae]|uniref:Putative ABC transport system ATP-binding protein/bacitracin transport system ATP-binding protein n=1 Tax=Facklamia miroungae TaxID=120956 RepID=A0A1G7QK92_9LACT|nr:ABC transporter ATP-binding protein [Facklamia miroungae]NKZ28971.1 ABC transporter ATP-binding protein [Facklamia miroungae]SDF98898.1 putative ABC transport system ATP-binding protein/bacitracin transport system ATP-binding protein [Facklamia miroungae]
MLLKVEHVEKIYKGRGNKTIALRDVDFGINEGEYVAIMGESGSGKSTLLNILATFDQPTAGKVLLNELDFSDLREDQIASFRREKLGFVFQDFNLLDGFTNRDNILLPMVLSQKNIKEMENQLDKVAKFVGVESLLDKYPYEISGGQAQRIAIARALINQPDIVLADEPTGALDSKTSEQIMQVLVKLNQIGNTILMVTHSIKAASSANRVLFIKDGVIYHEIYRGQQTSSDFQIAISDSLAMLNGRRDAKC